MKDRYCEIVHQELRLIWQASKLWRWECQQALETIMFSACLGLIARKNILVVHGQLLQ